MPATMHIAEPPPGTLEQSRAEWRRLGRRIAATSPAAVGRGLLTVAAIAIVVTVFTSTWPALLPFLLGGVIAYAVLPAVDRLDRIMPRWLAATLCVLVVGVSLVAVAVIILPPLAIGVVRMVAELPSRDQIDRMIADASAYLGSFPEGQAVLVPLLNDAVVAIRESLQSANADGGTIGTTVVNALLGLAGAAVTGVLAFIVLPSWMLSVMSGNREKRRALQDRIPSGIRLDVLAVVRIADRIAAAYIRGFLATGLTVSVLMYIGLQLSEAVGVSAFTQPLPIAVFAGVTQLVPDIGPIVGFLLALLLLPVAPDRAIAYVVIYIAARYIAGRLVGDRVMEPAQNVHPAFLVPAIIALSNLGLIWLFAAGPLVAITADVLRYAHGRLSDPPKPAGVLPHEALPPARAPVAGSTVRVPASYRPMTSR